MKFMKRTVLVAGGATIVAFLALGERVVSYVGQFNLTNYLSGVVVATTAALALVALGFFERLDI